MKAIKASLTANEWYELIVSAFSKKADPLKAVEMRNYMRGKFEFLGIQKPTRSMIQKELLQTYGIPTISVVEELTGLLWKTDEREFQYAALDLMSIHAKKLPLSFIKTLEYLILTKSWWDTVDLLSSKLAGNWCLSFPEREEEIINHWINHENLWLNRSALLYQLSFKDKTDSARLFFLITKKIGSKEFFIQKAIGWSLRQYARTSPEKVLEFVNQVQLQPLSKREALKHI
jgi:3-methyladenine DNA glycosylase AlkD